MYKTDVQDRQHAYTVKDCVLFSIVESDLRRQRLKNVSRGVHDRCRLLKQTLLLLLLLLLLLPG